MLDGTIESYRWELEIKQMHEYGEDAAGTAIT